MPGPDIVVPYVSTADWTWDTRSWYCEMAAVLATAGPVLWLFEEPPQPTSVSSVAKVAVAVPTRMARSLWSKFSGRSMHEARRAASHNHQREPSFAPRRSTQWLRRVRLERNDGVGIREACSNPHETRRSVG